MFQFDDGSNFKDVFSLTHDNTSNFGKVGINNTTPAEALDVNGNLLIQQDAKIQGNFTVDNNTTVKAKTKNVKGLEGLKDIYTINFSIHPPNGGPVKNNLSIDPKLKMVPPDPMNNKWCLEL